jgi:hypothetical protein
VFGYLSVFGYQLVFDDENVYPDNLAVSTLIILLSKQKISKEPLWRKILKLQEYSNYRNENIKINYLTYICQVPEVLGYYSRVLLKQNFNLIPPTTTQDSNSQP